MQNFNDEYFSDLFSPLKSKNVFIADATRNAVAQELKKQNFLSFNPKQFNVYYLGSLFIIGLIVVLSILSPKDSTPSATPLTKEEKKETPTHKKVQPPKKKKTKSPIKKVKFEQIPKITGTPTLIEIPKLNIKYNTKLPTIPDSIISKPIKKVESKKSTVVLEKKDTVYNIVVQDSSIKNPTQPIIDTTESIKKETLPVKVEPKNEVEEKLIEEVLPTENIEVSEDFQSKDKKRKRKKTKKD